MSDEGCLTARQKNSETLLREKNLNLANQQNWSLRKETTQPEDLTLGPTSQFCCIGNCFNLSFGRDKWHQVTDTLLRHTPNSAVP